ncbi:MAG: GAF domain-containing protein, partial [Aggregatilineales bacterium]
LPVPFALIGADVARSRVSMISFSISVIGIALIIYGLHVFTISAQYLRQQLRELQSLSVAAGTLRGNLDAMSIVRTGSVQISNLLNIQNLSIVLIQEPDNHLSYPLTIRNNREMSGQPDDDTLLKHVIDSETGLTLPHDSLTNDTAIKLPIGTVSWIGVPVISHTRILGAVGVSSDTHDRHFNHNDMRLLKILIGNIGVALENAHLYGQNSARASQLATLNQVLALLTRTLSPNDILDTIASSVPMISEASAVAVYLYQEDRRTLELVRSVGLSETFIHDAPRPLYGIHSNPTSARKRPPPLIISDIQTDDRALALRQPLSHEQMTSLVEVPLFMGDQMTGIISLYFDRAQAISGEQIDVLETFATQAATAIRNARTFALADAELEHRVEQLYVLAAMGRLLTASLSARRIYEIVLEYALESTAAGRGLVALYDTSENLTVAAQVGYPSDLFQNTQLLQQGLTGRVLNSGQVFRVEDTHRETNYTPFIPGTRSLMIVPVTRSQMVIGVILLESNTVAAFSQSDSHFITQMAYQASVAADNTRLFQRVRETRDNLQVILDAMEESIILIDSEYRVALANPRVNLIGLQPEQILQKSVSDLLADDDLDFNARLGFTRKDNLTAYIKQINHATHQEFVTHRYELPAEESHATVRQIQRHIIPVYDENERTIGLMLVFYNRTEEYELAQAREAFSQMTVHDLRSPLTAVTTSLRLLRELIPDDAPYYGIVLKSTDASRRAIHKVLSRVNALLDISRMESGELMLDREPSSLYYLVDSVYKQLSPLAHELNIKIELDVNPSLALLDVDADKVERMLMNLVDNALKYTPQNSQIDVRAHESGNNSVKVEIIDRGPGIPDEYKQRLFDRFVQVEGRRVVRHGVGLGLTFCKLVAEAHEGEIYVKDNLEGGSIFVVELPIANLERPPE